MATAKKKASARSSVPVRKPARAQEVETEEDMDGEGEGEVVEARDNFDYNAFFKENGLAVTDQDLVDISALTPIYASEAAYEGEWPPLYGLIVNRVEIKVAKDEPEDKQWRWFYVVEAEAETKAIAGTGDDKEEIDIAVGDYVLMPESGALKNKDRLKMAAIDPESVHHGLFRVTGQLDLNKPGRNPMWEIETFLVGKPVPRKGRYALDMTSRPREAMAGANGAPQLAPGSVVDSSGRPVQNLMRQ